MGTGPFQNGDASLQSPEHVLAARRGGAAFRFHVFASMAFAVALAITSKLLIRFSPLPAPLPEAFDLAAVLILGSSTVYAFYRVHNRRRIRYLVILAAFILTWSPLMNITEDLPVLRGLPVLGGGALHDLIEDNAFLVGFALLFVAFYLSLLEVYASRNLLAQERAGLAREVAERRRIEAALRESETKYRLVFEGANDGIALLATDLRPILANRRMAEMLGYTAEEFAASDPRMVIHPDDRERVLENNRRRLKGEQFERTYGFRMVRKSGQIIDVEASFDLIRQGDEILGIQGVYRDVTERKREEEERVRLQAKVLQAQKLESLGVLAGGIAHDFNNLLMGVLGNASLALLELPADSPIRSGIEQIEVAAHRAAELSKQMLAYSGKGQFVLQSLNVSVLVEEMIHLLESSISKRAALICRLAPNPDPIEGDPSQIRQVVMNLVTNASEALGNGDGEITITTGAIDANEHDLKGAAGHENLPAGRYTYVEVRDTGCGIENGTLERLFDPFFSTKFTGRGLGLAAALGIVRGHKGAIRVQSQPGCGTAFQVLFPCIARHEGLASFPVLSIAPGWRMEGTVLVIDDEPVVRNVTKRALEHAGIQVLLATDGVDAIQAFRDHAADVRLVILDLSLPKRNSEEVFDELRHIRPDVPVIVSSGYSEAEVRARFADRTLAAFIQKPYGAQELIATMQRVIEGLPASH